LQSLLRPPGHGVIVRESDRVGLVIVKMAAGHLGVLVGHAAAHLLRGAALKSLLRRLELSQSPFETVGLLETLSVLLVAPRSKLLSEDSNMIRVGAKEFICDDMLGDLSLIWIDDAIAIEIESFSEFIILLTDPTVTVLGGVSDESEEGTDDVVAWVRDR
jgi:hypothetical protein